MKKITIDKKEIEVPSGIISGKELYTIAECGEQWLYLNREGGIDIPVENSDFIIIHGGEKFFFGKPPEDKNPKLRKEVCPKLIDKKDGVSFSVAKNLGKDIKAKDDKFPNGLLFVDLSDAVDEEIKDDMCIIVQDKDTYFVVPSSEGHVDVEECVKNETRIPKEHKSKEHKYRIRVGKDKYVVDTMIITGAAILALVGKSADEWSINQKLKGGKREPISLGDSVDLSACGVERFELVRNSQQQGNETHYELMPEEEEYLNANYPSWDYLSGDGMSGLMMKNFPIPSGYTPKESDMMIIIPQGYPGVQLDMFCFSPELKKENGNAINNISTATCFDRSWQNWSRHYSWTPGEDDIISHIESVKRVLQQEVN